MTLDERVPVDPNAADLEALGLLPGVGPVLAERMIAARPFETFQDLTRVRGIGATTVARWQPLLALPSADAPAQPEPEDAAVAGAAEGFAAKVEPVAAPDVAAEPSVEAEDEEPEPPVEAEDEELERPDQASAEEPPTLREAMPLAADERRPRPATRWRRYARLQ